MHGGFMAGVEEQDGGGDQLVFGQSGAVFVACGEQLREEILSGHGPALGE